MYVNSCDQWEAIKELHRFRGLDLPKPEDTERQKESLEEFIARHCLKATAPAMNYLTEVRKIQEKIVEAAIKAKTVGWNSWTSNRVAPGEVGYGGPGAAFIVRSMNPGHVIAVDMRYENPDLNGGVKTQTQGPKDGAPWLPLQWRVMQSAKTMYIVESPINALSIEACGMPWTHALAVRGLTIETIDWSFLYGMQCVICMDADRSEEHTS